MTTLSQRVEQADGPSLELDIEIVQAAQKHRIKGLCGYEGVPNYDAELWLERHGEITGSLDAAMTLVPEGRKWSITPGYTVPFCISGTHSDKMLKTDDEFTEEWFFVARVYGFEARSKGASLALCAAALKARGL